MPKTKLSERAKWIKRLKSYKNPDPHCTYPWELGNCGYCWGFASWKDGDDKSMWHSVSGYKRVKDFGKEVCAKDCKYWREK